MAVQLQHGRVRERTDLRRGPSAEEPVVAVLPRGAAVAVFGREGEWLHVRAGEDDGYVSERLVEMKDPLADEPPPEQSSERPPEQPIQEKAAPRRKEAPGRGQRGEDIGEDIGAVQRQLRALLFSLDADGILGPATEDALRSFQESQDLEPTGRLNRETRAALAAAVAAAEGDAPRAVSAARHTVSDRPAASVAEDRLGFRDSVLALVEFLRSAETSPPLAIAVCAPWGRGKTSFMRMVDEELERTPAAMPVRFARVWFNPWKYDEDRHVWAALVAALNGCIQQSLGWRGRARFEARRFAANLRGRFDLGLGIRLGILLFLFAALIWLATDPSMQAFNAGILKSLLDGEAVAALPQTPIGALVPLLVAAFLAYQIYFKVFAVFNEGLLSYLQKHQYSDKAGTLAQFESEMRALNDSMPADLKVVVFVDDLDRCKPGILSQIIEAMQLLEVSRKCIFVLGMDMNIVVQTVENEYADVNPEVKRSLERAGSFQHGRGYHFLEKIIQVRLAVPDYGPTQMRSFAESLSTAGGPGGGSEDAGAVPGEASVEKLPVAQATAEKVTAETRETVPRETVPRDSPEVVEAITAYGARCFRNPRRLKRFVNAFRLHVYLAQAARLDLPVDRLARFLVLTEKWPGLVERLLEAPEALDAWQRDGALDAAEAGSLVAELERGLSGPLVRRLLRGPEGADPIDGAELRRLCDWFGFAYYP